jgi:asparagine synthase (glutamine-hydrolysing)
MCGFAGLLVHAPSGRSSLSEDAAGMAELLRHRGPDDASEWEDASGRIAFAFRRLAILDLSLAGRQPMQSPSGRYVMVFNGEIYNFEAIRAEIGVPRQEYRGGSDSEVLLTAVDRFGIEATLTRLIGMFAIALWDHREEELWLIRDRIGIKPLYAAKTGRGVAFASELGALTRAPGFDPTLDMAALEAYLRYLYIPGRATPFRNAQKIPPGHYLRIRDPGRSMPAPVAYWSLDHARASGVTSRGVGPGSPADTARTVVSLEELLADAVSLRMIADVPVGALLSGGIDSSLVVALMQRASSRPVRTFTVGFEGTEHDESAPARAIARHLGTDHSELPVTGQDALDLVADLPRIFDEPLANPSQIPTQLVSKLARGSVVVALSGDGGDELFAGYNRYTAGPAAAQRLSRLPTVPRRWLGRALQYVSAPTWDVIGGRVLRNGREMRLVGQKVHKMARMMGADNSPEMYRVLLSAWGDPGRFLDPRPAAGADPVREMLLGARRPLGLDDMLHLDQAYYLPDELLHKVDRASMSVGLEVRVPLLDHRIVERSWTLPDHFKVRDGQTKWILRQVLYRHVPSALVERPKTGFSVPVEDWLSGPLRPWAEDLLLSKSPARDALFRREEIGRVWQAFLGGRTELALGLWSMVMLEAWRRHWNIEAIPESQCAY